MSDNLDDDDMFDDDDSFEEFEEDSTTLGGMFESPLAKVGLILGAAALVFGIIVFFGGEKEPDINSRQAGGSDVSGIPGTEELNPNMLDAINEVNERRTEQAKQTGTSVLPIPTQVSSTVLQEKSDDTPDEDPLQRWRRLQREKMSRELERRDVIQPAIAPEDTQRSQAVSQMADALLAQMQSILARQKTKQWQTIEITDSEAFFQKLEDDQNEDLQEEIIGEDGEEEIVERIVIPAGEIEYAQLITEANSDVEGPVLAMVVSGPLRGSKLMGDFATTDNDQMTLNFDTAVIDGITYDISAIALDPETTLPAMATDVDHRYFQRIVIPVAASFIEGAAGIIADNTGSTNVSVEGDTVVEESDEADFNEVIAGGIEEAGSTITEIVDELNDKTDPLIIIRSGTPMGILFMEPVTQPEEEDF